MTISTELKPSLWDKEYIIENLPVWIYSDNKQPESVQECKAKISATQYTIRDIELQIEIRELELKTGSSRHNSSFEYEKWKAQALRAKQTHLYLLNAYTYWLTLTEKESVGNDPKSCEVSKTLKTLIDLLIEEPDDFVQQLEKLM
jgi:hypothetical protein